jgi:ubiquitin-conjugating enzyme E2 W
VYAGEHYVLSFKFGDSYPLSAPEVTFVGTPPLHPHIYSNGHLCLSILDDGNNSTNWTPVLTVRTVCLSILSMMSSCTEKKAPPDDAVYSRMNRKSPKQTKWLFHDDKI